MIVRLVIKEIESIDKERIMINDFHYLKPASLKETLAMYEDTGPGAGGVAV